MDSGERSERVKRIVSVLDSNKIRYNNKFSYVPDNGYADDACMDFSDELIVALDTLCEVAVNARVLGRYERCIDDMTDTCVALGDKKKAVKRLPKYQREMAGYLSQIRDFHVEQEGNMEMQNRVRGYVDDAIRVAEYQLSKVTSDMLKTRLHESIDKLNELKAELDKVINWTSKTALEYAVSIGVRITRWAEDVKVNMCSVTSVDLLVDAIAKCKEWQKQTRETGKRDLVKDEVIQEKLPSQTIMRSMLSGLGQLETLQVFMDSLKEYNNDTNVLREALSEREVALREQDRVIAENQQRRAGLLARLDNGEISTSEVRRLGQMYDDNIAEARENRGFVAVDVNEYRDSINSRDIMSDRFVELVKKINLHRNDPGFAKILVECLDFRLMNQVLLGQVNGSEADVVFAQINNVVSMINVKRDNQHDIVEGLKEMRKEQQEKLTRQTRERSRVTNTSVVSEQEKEKDEDYISKLRAEMQAQTPAESVDVAVVRENPSLLSEDK